MSFPTDVFFKKKKREIADIEQPARRWMIARGWIFDKVSSATRDGWPDRVAIKYGLTIWVELKAPGKKPEPHQVEVHEMLRAVGATVVWFDDLETFKAYFRKIDDENSF